MTRLTLALSLAWLVLLLAIAPAAAESEKYTLRYQFHPGETLRWNVAHRTRVRTAVSGTEQTAETISESVKAWRVKDVKPDGTAAFIHSVESVDMRQKLTGRPEARYNSRTDKTPPAGFAGVAQSVGVPLSLVTLDATGKVLKRERKPLKAAAQGEGQMTIPLPEQPVAVGHTWSFPCDVDVTLEGGTIKKIKTLQKFELVGVKTGVATIHVETRILTPIDNPALEAQVVQCQSAGTVRFDIDAGRVLAQQMDLDKHVVGFRGEASSLHYVTRFTEELLPPPSATAARPSDPRR